MLVCLAAQYLGIYIGYRVKVQLLTASSDLKIKIFKLYFCIQEPTWVENSLSFAPSFMVSEITTNLRFLGQVTLRGNVTSKSSKLAISYAVTLR